MKLLGAAVVSVWVFVIVLALGEMYLARASADPVTVVMETCQFEDGNLDGKPCMWIDPDTGKGYISLSEAYWNEY